MSRIFPQLAGAPVVSDYLIPYVYLSDVIFGITLAIWLIKRRIDTLHTLDRHEARHAFEPRQRRLTWGSWWVWFGAFLVVAAVSLVVNQIGWWGWWKWFKLVEGGGLVWYFSVRLQQPTVARRYGLLLLTGLGFESVLLIIEWLRQSSLGLQWLGEWRFNVQTPGVAKIIVQGQEILRPMGTFAHPNIAGGVLALALPLGLAMGLPVLGYWSISKKWLQAARWLGIGLMGVALLVSFSRTAWVVGLVGVVWLGAATFGKWRYWLRARFQLTNRRGLTVGIVGLAVILGLILPLMASRFGSLASTDELSYERRVQLSAVAIELWQSHVWLGVGLNNFVVQLAGYGPLYGIGVWRQPVHDWWLLVGVETGLVGFVSMCGFLGVIWWQLFSQRQRIAAWIGYQLLIGGWIGWILLGLGDHYWWTSQQGLMVTWLICGVSIAVLGTQSNDDSQRNDPKAQR